MKNNFNYKKHPKKATKGGGFSAVDVNDKFAHIEAIQLDPLEVKVYNNLDRAIKAFRALVQKERILSLYKEKSAYEKPSDKRRRKRKEMERKLMELEGKLAPKKHKRPKKHAKKESDPVE